ncbi:HEPN domain-containing protein [Sulfobacillus harzensis]|uniref:HEPN domain-containing protein n=1 Tax=Sulfobacillus harzensis TaxID=2729629 RepID=A0A7Y0Q4B9_9FIRM|nr:HEPN domain-containing protein [Sulfobacillus harzensis]NMP25158.1 HEPN domain-containing protein [Sulfobacillus harzensis]
MPNPIALEWLSFATRDLEAARTLSQLPSQASTACFHAQQAAEKALKSLYAASGQTPPKTHDLDVLREKLPGGDDLSSLVEACTVLSMYAVDSRYPGAHIEEEEVSPAIAFAECIISKVQAVLREKDGPEAGP